MWEVFTGSAAFERQHYGEVFEVRQHTHARRATIRFTFLYNYLYFVYFA